MRMIRFYASVPSEYQRQGIKFLVLEYDALDTKGWYLFLHASMEEGCLYDNWYENKKSAEYSARIYYNITHDMWKPLDCETYYPWVKRMNSHPVGYYAPIPTERQTQDIKFLVLKNDILGRFGANTHCLFAHESLEERCLSATWYQNKNQAETTAELRYGVTPDMWKKLDSDTYHP
jgi:hypothetical protein